ncbi:MAG: ribonuclease H-like domain-containing protein [Deltaproteobacteria bacterium]|nr:ribonuclease H-like domain-containing protein [Deltaproteobacteria bacterium]
MKTVGARRTSGRRTHLQKLYAQLAECSRQPDRVLFLDVETTGLDPCRHEITVVGWAFGGRVGTMVKGSAPDLLCEDLEQARYLVTFNGGRFDTRFVARFLPGITLPRVHIDLLYLCRSVGLSGGQKAIEKALRIDLRKDVTEVTGLTAVALWNQSLQGDHEALRRLILYNRSDVAAMGAILDEVIRRMNTRLGPSMTEVRFRDWSAPPGWRTLPHP